MQYPYRYWINTDRPDAASARSGQTRSGSTIVLWRKAYWDFWLYYNA